MMKILAQDTRVNKMRVTNENREKWMSHLESQEAKDEAILLCDIKHSFQGIRFSFPNQILAIQDKDITLNNQDVIKLPIVLGFHLE